MTAVELAFDLVLALALVAIAVSVLATRAVVHGAVLYIAFGLLLVIAWTRLGAADLALAEAAIGAGLAGVLLLQAARATRSVDESEQDAPQERG